MEISVPSVLQLPFHCANVPVGRPFLRVEEGKTQVDPMLPVGGIGVSFGVVIEAEFKAAARADHVCGTAVFVVRRLLQARISANGTDKFLLAHDNGLSRLV